MAEIDTLFRRTEALPVLNKIDRETSRRVWVDTTRFSGGVISKGDIPIKEQKIVQLAGNLLKDPIWRGPTLIMDTFDDGSDDGRRLLRVDLVAIKGNT